MSEPTKCRHCQSRNINHLQDSEWECYDCGKTFLSTECDPQAQKMRELEDKFRAEAKKSHIGGELEIDDDAPVKISEDFDSINGAYVQAWIYVSIEEVKS